MKCGEWRVSSVESNVTKCHACHAKRHDHLFLYGHQKQGHANTRQPPDPQNVKREPFATYWGKTVTNKNSPNP